MSNESSPALPEGPSDTVKDAFDCLDLDPETATLDDVETAFYQKVPEVHPDEMDGDDDAFTALLHARQTARSYLQ